MSTQPDYRQVYSEVMPSVVSIYVGRTDGDATRPGRGAGSGFVYDGRGHVVTNRHVVAPPRATRTRQGTHRVEAVEADAVEVRFSRGDWRTADVVGADPHTDLAVVRVDDVPAYAGPLPVAETSPEPGEPVAALGNPLGLDGSITSGIVSGTNRSMSTGGGFALPDTVQTDAPINPGNSGGPLVTVAEGERLRTAEDGERSASGASVWNGRTGSEAVPERGDPRAANSEWDDDLGTRERGAEGDPRAKVVGVNRARQGDNIGFAVSPEIVERVVPSLIEEGRHRHPYLKVRTLDVSPIVAEANGLDDPRGILVVEVRLGPSSGALVESSHTTEIRGRKVPVGGDVILAIDGERVDAHEELMRYLVTSCEPGETVTLTVLRGGDERTLEVELAERPAPGGEIPVQ